MNPQSLTLTLLALSLALLASCGPSGATCSSAQDALNEEFDALDRSCTEDADCEYRSIDVCGCPIPVNVSANTADYARIADDVQNRCGDAASGPGTQTCTNNLVCVFGDVSNGGSPVCGAQGICVDPPFEDDVAL